MNIVFESMAAKHGPQIMDVFNYYVENSFAAYPKTPLPPLFFSKFLEMTNGYPAFAMVDEHSGQVAGFCFLKPYSPFPTFRRTAEISYFLKPDYTHKGLGTAALQKLQDEAAKMRIRCLLAGISSRNEQSLCFHKKNGFVECGRFKEIGEKKALPFDVIWMQKILG